MIISARICQVAQTRTCAHGVRASAYYSSISLQVAVLLHMKRALLEVRHSGWFNFELPVIL